MARHLVNGPRVSLVVQTTCLNIELECLDSRLLTLVHFQFITDLHYHSQCTEYIHAFLNLIQFDMFHVTPHSLTEKSRMNINQVNGKLIILLNRFNDHLGRDMLLLLRHGIGGVLEILPGAMQK